MRKVFMVLLVLMLVMTTMIACGKGSNQSSEGPANSTDNPQNNQQNEIGSNENELIDKDATVVIGIKSSVLTLDPANHRDRVTESVLRNIFDGLVTRDENGEVIPKIAKSWENTSPTEWIFTLHEGVKFHDGSDLTAEDVKFTFERVINEGAMAGETSPRKGLIEPLKEVQIINDYQVKFILSEPWPILLKMLPHQQIVPKAYLEKVGDAEFREKPIGAGPFKVVDAKLDERIILERFDEYYDGPVNIGKLVFDVIPENSSRVASLQAGEVQRIHSLSPTMLTQLENDPDVEIKMADGTRVYMIEMNTTMAPFDDVRVRKAMNHAVNMDLILETILGGYGVRLAGPMLYNAFGIDENLNAYEYDPEKAKQLLAEAGYSDGFNLVIDTTANNKEVAEAVASQLRNIGIDASARVWDVGVITPMLLNGERQMFMGDWGNSTQDPYDFLNPKLMTKDRANYSIYSNARVDELLKSGSVEIDVDKRKEMYKEAQQIIYDDAPWIFGYQLKEIEAGVKKLKNWNPNPDGMLNMYHAYLEK